MICTDWRYCREFEKTIIKRIAEIEILDHKQDCCPIKMKKYTECKICTKWFLQNLTA